MAVELLELTVVDAVAWRKWLSEHHGTSRGVWLVLAKKGTTQPTSLTYDQALESAIASAADLDLRQLRWSSVMTRSMRVMPQAAK